MDLAASRLLEAGDACYKKLVGLRERDGTERKKAASHLLAIFRLELSMDHVYKECPKVYDIKSTLSIG